MSKHLFTVISSNQIFLPPFTQIIMLNFWRRVYDMYVVKISVSQENRKMDFFRFFFFQVFPNLLFVYILLAFIFSFLNITIHKIRNLLAEWFREDIIAPLG